MSNKWVCASLDVFNDNEIIESNSIKTGYTVINNKIKKYIKPFDNTMIITVEDEKSEKVTIYWGNDWLSGNMNSDEKNKILTKITSSDDEFIALSESFGITFNEATLSDSDDKAFLIISKKQIRDFLFNDSMVEKTLYEKYAFKRHILLIGEKGSGKTYEAYDYISNTNHEHIFIGGNADMDATDMKGMLVPYSNGSDREFIWVDGPLTEAFRKAQTKKIVLLIDEMLRISPNGQSLFISTLTPDNKRQYVLNTGRIIDVVDGVGKQEIIRIPIENLFVVATTNIGIEYDIGNTDEALLDRFLIVDKNTTLVSLTKVLKNTIDNTDWVVEDDKPLILKRVLGFFEAYKNVCQNVDLKTINVRHLNQVIEDSCSFKDLKKSIIDKIPTWAKRDIDGTLNEEHVNVLEKLIGKHF